MSGCIQRLSTSHSPVFLLNSCLDLFSAPQSLEDPLFRSYGVSLPSSLTVNHPSASVYSTQPRVSVSSTGAPRVKLSGFSRESDYVRCRLTPGGSAYCQVRLGGWICLPPSAPTPFNLQFRLQAALSLLRLHVATRASDGMLTVSSIGLGFRLILRSRLTLNRLALFRKPWSFGEGASHPLYRYLFLHLPFRTLQSGSRRAFDAERNAPLPIHMDSTASAGGLYPIIIHAQLLD